MNEFLKLDGFLDDDRLENLDDAEREYYEYVMRSGDPDEIERAMEYFD